MRVTLQPRIVAGTVMVSWTFAAVMAAASTFNSALMPCPAPCSDTGSSPANWTVYHRASRLTACKETMLLDFAIYNPIDDPDTHVSIRSCSTDSSGSGTTVANTVRRDKTACDSKPHQIPVEASLQMAWMGSNVRKDATEVVTASKQMQNALLQSVVDCNRTQATITFTYSGQAVVGFYAGAEMQRQGIATSVLQQFIDRLESEGISDSLLIQLCGAVGRGADYALGIIASTNGSLPQVQSAVKTWNDGKCVTLYDGGATWISTSFLAPTAVLSANISTVLNSSLPNSTTVNSTLKEPRAALPLRVLDYYT